MPLGSEKTDAVAIQNEFVNSPPVATEVPWWKQPLLRRLYFMMTFLFLGSTTLGYDGSVLNGLQTMTTWQDCKGSHPKSFYTTDFQISDIPLDRDLVSSVQCQALAVLRYSYSHPTSPTYSVGETVQQLAVFLSSWEL